MLEYVTTIPSMILNYRMGIHTSQVLEVSAKYTTMDSERMRIQINNFVISRQPICCQYLLGGVRRGASDTFHNKCVCVCVFVCVLEKIPILFGIGILAVIITLVFLK